MINILAIGNSFSEDATMLLHQTCAAAHVDTMVVNLYIGGCPLEKHWQNIEKDEVAYQVQYNGRKTERRASIQQALGLAKWDYIITQQASHDSGWADSYEPFLSMMLAYLRQEAPQAKICLQQTWAYEIDSHHEKFIRYNRDQAEMYRRLTECYRDAATSHGLKLIPSGEVIQKLRTLPPFQYENGGLSLCRDGFHMHWLYGRYALALTWAHTLLGIKAQENTFVPTHPDFPELKADPELLEIIRQTVDQY